MNSPEAPTHLIPRVSHLAIKILNVPAPMYVRYGVVDKIVDVLGVQPQMVNQKYTWKLNVLVEYNEYMVTLCAKTLKWKPTNTPNSSTPSTIHNIEPEGTSPSKRLYSECIITCSNKSYKLYAMSFGTNSTTISDHTHNNNRLEDTSPCKIEYIQGGA